MTRSFDKQVEMWLHTFKRSNCCLFHRTFLQVHIFFWVLLKLLVLYLRADYKYHYLNNIKLPVSPVVFNKTCYPRSYTHIFLYTFEFLHCCIYLHLYFTYYTTIYMPVLKRCEKIDNHCLLDYIYVMQLILNSNNYISLHYNCSVFTHYENIEKEFTRLWFSEHINLWNFLDYEVVFIILVTLFIFAYRNY